MTERAQPLAPDGLSLVGDRVRIERISDNEGRPGMDRRIVLTRSEYLEPHGEVDRSTLGHPRQLPGSHHAHMGAVAACPHGIRR